MNVEEVDTGGKNSMRFVAVKDGKEQGYIQVHKLQRKVRGKTVWAVSNVKAHQERRGVGTVLYQAAAQAVCKKRNRLVSYGPRTDKSEGFWRKQERKGRATQFRTKESGKYTSFMLDCDQAGDLGVMPGIIRNVPWWVIGAAALLTLRAAS